MRRRVATLVLGFLGALTSCERENSVTAPVRARDDTKPLATAEAALAAIGTRRDPPTACPKDMVEVQGEYCPKVQLNCKKYLDPEGRYEKFRCAEYGPTTCLSKQRRKLSYCIDRYEYSPPGDALPANRRSFTHAEKTCRSLGKRVCLESEWNFACEGEEMRPYPYGFTRDPGACNADRDNIVSASGELRDLRAPSGSHPRCASPFGVFDLSGNLEEFVAMDGRGPARPAMKGAYWQPGRNFCRAAQTAHDRYYNGTETGFRCCSDTQAR